MMPIYIKKGHVYLLLGLCRIRSIIKHHNKKLCSEAVSLTALLPLRVLSFTLLWFSAHMVAFLHTSPWCGLKDDANPSFCCVAREKCKEGKCIFFISPVAFDSIALNAKHLTDFPMCILVYTLRFCKHSRQSLCHRWCLSWNMMLIIH